MQNEFLRCGSSAPLPLRCVPNSVVQWLPALPNCSCRLVPHRTRNNAGRVLPREEEPYQHDMVQKWWDVLDAVLPEVCVHVRTYVYEHAAMLAL